MPFMTWMSMNGWTICFRNGGERMSKRTIAPRERLRRQGNFWEEGMELTQADRELLRPLIERAKELGYTPPRAQVPGCEKIKARFRCWKDAVMAAGLSPLNDPNQAEKRLAAKASVIVMNDRL